MLWFSFVDHNDVMVKTLIWRKWIRVVPATVCVRQPARFFFNCLVGVETVFYLGNYLFISFLCVNI